MTKSPDKMLLSLLKKKQPDYDAIKASLDQGANPFAEFSFSMPSVYEVLERNDLETLTLLVNHPLVKFDYEFCLYHSITNDKEDMTDFLLTQVEKNQERLSSWMLLKEAYAEKNHPLFCQLLTIYHSPDIYDGSSYMPKTALEWQDQKYFEAFVTAGADMCLAVSKSENDRDSDLSLMEYMAERPKYHQHLAFVLEHGKVPFAGLEKAMIKALKSSAANNIRLLQNAVDQQAWQFDPNTPSKIIHYSFQFTPQHSLTEVFNFKRNSGERVSILKNIDTNQESMTRESFSMIDDPDVILQAARELEKAGGKPEDAEIVKTPPHKAPIVRRR